MGQLEGLYAASRDRRIWEYMLGDRPENLEEMRSLLEEILRDVSAGSRVCFTVRNRETGEVLGSTSYLEISERDRRLEIGYTWLDPRYWRTAINTECKLLLLGHAFEALGAVRVQLKTDARNERSRRAIERLGAEFEGILRCYQTRFDGYVRDTALYSIVAREWPEVKARLEAMLAR